MQPPNDPLSSIEIVGIVGVVALFLWALGREWAAARQERAEVRAERRQSLETLDRLADAVEANTQATQQTYALLTRIWSRSPQ